MININEKVGKRLSLLNTYENFDTGEIKKLVKVKPIQVMKNVCTVDIINSHTGKVRERVQSENIVNNYLNSLFTQSLFLEHVFTQIPQDSSAYLTGRTLFGAIFLTNYTGAEDADAPGAHGNVIAWADRKNTYIGADTKRGTINWSETTLVDVDTVRYVFDWPTNTGNGTFRTAYFCPAYSIASGTSWTVPTTAITTASMNGSSYNGSTNTYCGCVVNGRLYHTTASGYIYSTGMSIFSTYIARDIYAGALEKDFSATDNTLRGIQWDGTNFWAFGDQYDKMYKLDTSFNVVSSWSITVATYLSTYKQFTCFGGKIYTIKYVNSTTINLYKFATDGTLEATYNILTAGGNYDTLATKNDDLILTNDGERLVIVSPGSAVSSVHGIIETDGLGTVKADYMIYWRDGTLPSVSKTLAWNNDYKLWEQLYSTQTNMIGLLRKPTTQTLLPSSVTKTSSDYMKVTYTLNVDLTSF